MAFSCDVRSASELKKQDYLRNMLSRHQPESAQVRGEAIIRRRFSFTRQRNYMLRQIRGFACHADQYVISETKFRSSGRDGTKATVSGSRATV